MEITTPPAQLQQEINSWKEIVNEVRTEVKMMRERLEQIVLSTAPPEVMAKVEHFENRFLRQREVADETYHDIKQCAKAMADEPQKVIHDDRPVDDYHTMQHRMEIFQKLYVQLKDDFNHFITCEV
jgi:chromosome segregation ATPase